MHFLHACRNAGVFAFRDHLSAVAAAHPQVTLHVRQDEGAADAPAQVGTLDLRELGEAVLAPGADYYLCGPADFMQNHIRTLHALGVGSERIHAEVFSTGGVAV